MTRGHPLSYPSIADNGNRTHIFCLEGRWSTVNLYPPKFRSRRCVPNRPIIGAGLAFHAQRLCPAQAPSRMRVMDHSCSIHFIYDNSWNAIASRSYLSDSRAIEPNRGATENCEAEAAGNRATIRPEKQSISTGTASFEA